MRLVVEVRGGQVWRRLDDERGGVLPDRLSGAAADATGLLEDWAGRYRKAVEAGSAGALLTIGQEMLGWLDTGDALKGWLAAGERVLEVHADPAMQDALKAALLAAPWEILARDGMHLAADRIRLFTIARRCSPQSEPVPPVYSDLSLLFMAAAPEGVSDLAYEAEEVAILEATAPRTGGAPLAHLTVEESGARLLLGERCRRDGPFEVVHLSCHGDILKPDHSRAKPGETGAIPKLLLEDEEGGADLVPPERLVEALEGGMPPLLFLSACRTAEGRAAAKAELAEPYVQLLAPRVANVLGWDGSVYDSDASSFSEALYGALAQGETVPNAAARARRALFDLAAQDARCGRHWHLARVYLGPGGGGALCDPRAHNPRPAPPTPEVEFLDPTPGFERVPVARRSEFVGRRRQLQRILRELRGATKGVLIHGFGNLGKSSLAARVTARLDGYRPVVVFGAYHALAIVQDIQRAANAIADGLDRPAAQALLAEIEAMGQAVATSEAALEGELRRLLNGTFRRHPMLLIVDDVERALEEPAAGKPVVELQPDLRPAIAAVLRAFAAAQTPSRLLLTSRYDFVLRDTSGVDLAASLARVHLPPMPVRERDKQLRAKVRADRCESAAALAPAALITRALDAAAGNPGLQEILTRPLLHGEIPAAEAAIAAVEHYRATGAHPKEGNAAQAFFARMSFETYRAALTPAQRETLAAATVFDPEVPIPRPALMAAATALGVAEPQAALDRLLALGLLDDWGILRAGTGTPLLPHAAVNALARPLAGALDVARQQQVAAAALAPLAAAWRDEEGDFPFDPRGVAACRLALDATAGDPALLEATALAAVVFLFRIEQAPGQALALAVPALERLALAEHVPGGLLLAHVITAAERTGEADLQDRLLATALAQEGLDKLLRAQLLGLKADRLVRLGQLDQALAIRQNEQLPVFEALGDKRSLAITKGRIADILQARGELDQALAIRQNEELPVYEALGDKCSLALTKGRIADILQARGELDQALAIRQNEELPVYEALGDKRELAVSRGKIADILQARGELDQALAIRQNEQLPVYEALGDKRSLAVTRGQIADILQARGELDQALAIRQNEELPVYEALGDKRSTAVTRGQIADILQARGQLDRALEIRENEELPAYEALGDRRSLAVTKGKIADILQTRGQLDQALAIRENEELPVFEALGDKRELAVTKGRIADILQARGQLDQALALHRERLPAATDMRDADSIAHVRFSCAQVRLQRGDHKSGGLQTIADELAEAWRINTKLDRPDGIGAVGELFGQVLAMGGHPDEGAKVLETAAAAWERIGQTAQAEKCSGLAAQIRGSKT